ncbi:MAG: exodeoxyribonuclease VII small subunit [Spirochaetaceae bacterium]|nr:exodeoxyribonuclease VII small subunit [Spirochaetaceae bacterium]MBO4728590.1 exodeoxyribonuclease VII small subunit [Spirochaetaceae bacterium]MBR4824328.1 exodeoxyribonuclease VII small subunit [Spirochaetaceae bacterium]
MNTIEERLEKLEKLSDSIKDSDLGIEEAMALFDEGIKLVRGIEKDLDAMEGKIQMLMNQPDEEETEKAGASKSKSKTKKANSAKPELELFNFEPKSVSHE